MKNNRIRLHYFFKGKCVVRAEKGISDVAHVNSSDNDTNHFAMPLRTCKSMVLRGLFAFIDKEGWVPEGRDFGAMAKAIAKGIE